MHDEMELLRYLERLRSEFPNYELALEFGRNGYRYISRTRQLGRNPYAVITGDGDELREILHRAQVAQTEGMTRSACE